jgi:hypothetical protein
VPTSIHRKENSELSKKGPKLQLNPGPQIGQKLGSLVRNYSIDRIIRPGVGDKKKAPCLEFVPDVAV